MSEPFKSVDQRTPAARVLVGRNIRLAHDQPSPEPAAILIDQGRIAEVSQGSAIPPPTWPRGTVTDLGDLIAGPALLDMHVHVTERAHGDDDVMVGLPDDSSRRMNALEALESLGGVGATRARDCGGPFPLIFDIARRSGAGTSGAHLYASGAPLTPTGGHAARMGGEARDNATLGERIEAFASAGATQIKVMASGGGTAGSRPWDPAFTSEQLSHIVHASRSVALPITAHCLSAAAILQALKAGINTIEHAKFRTPSGNREDATIRAEVASQLLQHGAVIVPTLSVGHFVALRAPCDAEAREVWAHRQPLDLMDTQDLIDAGVTVAAGTDAGWRWTPFNALPTEIELLTRCGLSASSALCAASNIAAHAAAIPGLTGRLNIAAPADVVAYTADPHKDITVLSGPALVLREGEPIHATVRRPTKRRKT